MSSYDDATVMRARAQSAQDAYGRFLAQQDAGSPVVLVKTVTITTYPTTAGSFYGVQLVIADGTEAEGSAVSFTAITNTFMAYNLGGAIPPAGTYLLVTQVGHNWVFRYD